MNRGLMVVDAGVSIMGKDIDNKTVCQLAVLGWAIEWLQAWLLVADDIMDSSVTRRGQPCWYKTLGDAWYIAINDAVTIESMVYKIIKRHFSHDSKLCSLGHARRQFLARCARPKKVGRGMLRDVPGAENA